MSQRHEFEPGEDALLDAARACVLAVGVRRTTFTDVARRAGVSRMTLYRRFPDLEALLSALMTREFGRVVADARRAAPRAPTARERVGRDGRARLRGGWPRTRCSTGCSTSTPSCCSPTSTQRLGGMQRMAVAGLAAELAAGADDGSVRDGAPPRCSPRRSS